MYSENRMHRTEYKNNTVEENIKETHNAGAQDKGWSLKRHDIWGAYIMTPGQFYLSIPSGGNKLDVYAGPRTNLYV